MTPTETPTATPTQPPVITGISARFTETSPGVIVIQIHVLLPDDDSVIHDLEIYFNLQQPPWQGVEPIQGPPGWQAQPITAAGGTQVVGIQFVTSEFPLRTCQPVQIMIQVIPPGALGNFIIIYLTDANHNVIGQIAAQRVAAPAFGAQGADLDWLSTAIAQACPPPN